MSGQRINGKSFDIRVSGWLVTAESMTLDIEDTTTAAKSQGRPDGFLPGEVSASGEVVFAWKHIQPIIAAAAAAGSFQDLAPVPIHCYAVGGGEVAENAAIYADGCKLTISSLLNVDPNATDISTVTVPFIVTGEDFVAINGVPYASGTGFGLI